MLKKCVGLMVLFFPLAVCAQEGKLPIGPAEQAHFGVAQPQQPGTDLLKSAKVSQAAATAQLKELAKEYPAHAADVQAIINMHERLANVLRNEQQMAEKDFYQNVLFLMEDLAAAVSGIKNEALVQACTTAIDHGYYFAPIGKKLSSLRVITVRVEDNISILSNGYATPQWGDFYKYLDGYSH